MDGAKSQLILSAPASEILERVAGLGIYITDLDRRIVFWNSTAEKITGWTREEVVDKCCKEDILCHTDRHGRRLCVSTVCPLHLCMAENRSRSVSTYVFAKKRDGTRIPMFVSVSPIHDSNGKVIGGIEIFREAAEEAFQSQLVVEVQRALFPDPKQLATYARIGYSYCLAADAGGDMFICFQLRDGRVAGVVLDICGHGLAAAMVSAFLRSSLSELREKRIDQPSEILDFLSRKRAEFAIRINTFSALAFVFNPTTVDLTLSRAGHPYPIVIDAAGKGSVLEVDGGAPIGYFVETDFPDVSVDIRGKRLVLYSDGISESRSSSGEHVDHAGIIAVCEQNVALSPELCAKKLVEWAFAFAGTGDPQDDMLAVVLDGTPL
ncbi:MAG TPA: SpoIIE family protein phosphatase [Candidatus Ozemobacteraceae bacterium]|nr:SpoIIE family protein phosphatase [Candidatus Ozemobacteraceae bacterium]HQG27396.1 SpoIIE family protein phosphatase [Candidatus Ozemobacteraceae bacterium]